MTPQWFAVRVQSRCEKVVAAAARGKGFEDFLPAAPVPASLVRPVQVGGGSAVSWLPVLPIESRRTVLSSDHPWRHAYCRRGQDPRAGGRAGNLGDPACRRARMPASSRGPSSKQGSASVSQRTVAGLEGILVEANEERRVVGRTDRSEAIRRGEDRTRLDGADGPLGRLGRVLVRTEILTRLKVHYGT